MPPADPRTALSGEALPAGVTDAMVALHLRYYHRTPTTAKTRLLEGDLLACTLGGIYTDVEKTLIEVQPAGVVQASRGDFQTAMQQAYIVEQLSGRDVAAFIATHHVGPDLSVQLFLLEPDRCPEQEVCA